MGQRGHRARAVVVMAVAALLAGCTASDRAQQDSTAVRDSGAAAPVAPTPATGVPGDTLATPSMPDTTTARDAVPVASVRLEVDVTARQVRLLRGDQVVATHPVAVGSAEWPTRTGEWHVTQVVWNPEWIPPDESWAEQRQPRKPGDPANPLGQAQLVYDPPRSIHGTNDPASIGKAVSHGSIRVTNTVAKQLARQLMEETGVVKDEAWYRATQEKRTVKQIVDLPQRVPIRVF